MKLKKNRINISLECSSCKEKLKELKIKPSFKYYTTKNKINLKTKLVLRKYCRYCKSQKLFNETK